MSHESTASKAKLLNAKVGKYQTGVDNSTNPLSPEDIAYGLAILTQVTHSELGRLLYRVKWANQSIWIDKLITETMGMIQQLVNINDARIHRKLAELVLREVGAIRPLPVKQVWTGTHAEQHTDRLAQCKCPQCGTECHPTPGKMVTCYNAACTGRRKDKPLTFMYFKLTRPERRQWTIVANHGTQMGMDDGEVIKYANDVLANKREFHNSDTPIRWEAAPEMCPYCRGAHERVVNGKVVTCTSCHNGTRRWSDRAQCRYVFSTSGQVGRVTWNVWLERLYRREIKGELLQIDYDTLANIEHRIR